MIILEDTFGGGTLQTKGNWQDEDKAFKEDQATPTAVWPRRRALEGRGHRIIPARPHSQGRV